VFAYSRVTNKRVDWLHGDNNFPTSCIQTGCEEVGENHAVVPCPGACPTDIQPPKDPPTALPECPDTPLVLDLGRRGFEFSSLEDGISFDIDGDGSVERISWTATESEDAFLALDRNLNGIVDNGRELFGGVTEQPQSGSPNGFAALAVFDDPSRGGNGDGRISASDEVYPDLWLWTDWSHDGYSDAMELTGLSKAGILWIDLDYFNSRRRDRHGNQLQSLSRFVNDRPVPRWITDVVFVRDGT
jgi:hypothetical protein